VETVRNSVDHYLVTQSAISDEAETDTGSCCSRRQYQRSGQFHLLPNAPKWVLPLLKTYEGIRPHLRLL